MKEWIKDIAIALIIAIIVIQFVKPTIVKESSMQPTLYQNNYIFLSKQAYTFGEPNRGDIIVFHSKLVQENGDEKLLIKRIIGLPGEELKINNGIVYINGVALKENYTMENYTSGDIDIKVPKGELFVMGDNRQVSVDSRYSEIGCVKIKDIVGEAIFRIYPFNKIRTF